MSMSMSMSMSMDRNNNNNRRRVSPAVNHRRQSHDDWKESLRRACLDRARQNRKDVIWKKRQFSNTGAASGACGDLMDEQQQLQLFTSTNQADNNTTNNNTDEIRSMVEQELRQQGVAVLSPDDGDVVHPSSNPYATTTTTTATTSDNQHYYQHDDGPTDVSFEQERPPLAAMERQNSYDSDSTEYVISEEELFDLLQDVEEEMRRTEEELLEEVLVEEQRQQQDIDDQIADFEEWEHSLAPAGARTVSASEEEAVVCPICCESTLQQSPPFMGSDASIKCPNETCSFHLIPSQQQQQQQQQQSYAPHHGILSLLELKERLSLAFEGHSVRCNSGALTFEMQSIAASSPDGGVRCESQQQQQQQQQQLGECLVGSCQQCHVNLIIT